MKKIISIMVTAALTLAMMTGCSGNTTTGSVSTDGSTSMEKVIGALGEAFQNDTGITFTYNPTGSGSGIKAVQEGRCDIGLSSRDLKAEEKDAGLTGTILAYDGNDGLWSARRDTDSYRRDAPYCRIRYCGALEIQGRENGRSEHFV